MTIEASIEHASINRDVTRVSNGKVNLNAQRTELRANIEATDVTIEIGGNVVLAGDVCYERPMAERVAGWLARLARRYRTKSSEHSTLRYRVDAIPASLAIAQAALEKFGDI